MNASRATTFLGIVLLALSSLARAQSSRDDPHHGEHHGEHEPGRHDATAHHRFDDAEAWAREFENPERDAWQLPDRVVSELVTRDDLVIADIGSATGYFPMRFARAVPNGRVYGVDIEPSMIFYLNDRARRAGLTNLTGVLAEPDDPHLPSDVDLIFICDTYHHIDDRISYMSRLGDAMRPGDRVAIVDFRLDSTKGPPHKLDPAIVREEMAKARFEEVASYDFLPEQYFLVFERRQPPRDPSDTDD